MPAHNNTPEVTGYMFTSCSNCTNLLENVETSAKPEGPNAGGLTKIWIVHNTTEQVEKEGASCFGTIAAELMSGNQGTGSVSAGVAKGHWMTTATLDLASVECWWTAQYHGVEASSTYDDGDTGERTYVRSVMVSCTWEVDLNAPTLQQPENANNLNVYCNYMVSETTEQAVGLTDGPRLGTGMGGMTIGTGEAPKVQNFDTETRVAELENVVTSVGGNTGMYSQTGTGDGPTLETSNQQTHSDTHTALDEEVPNMVWDSVKKEGTSRGTLSGMNAVVVSKSVEKSGVGKMAAIASLDMVEWHPSILSP